MSDFNYYAVYGTMMGNTVKADSNLANELHHTLIQKSANLLKEVICPQDFALMRGYDGKTTKNNITDQFSFSFGDQEDFGSDFDAAAAKLYKALGEKTKALGDKKGSNDCDMMPDIKNYFDDCIMNDEPLVWRYAKSETLSTMKSVSASQVSEISSPRKSQVSVISPRKKGQVSPEKEHEESFEDDEQILNRLKSEKGNVMQRAVSVYLYKALIEKRKEYKRMHDDFTIGVFGECG